jgi:hypothetical protein
VLLLLYKEKVSVSKISLCYCRIWLQGEDDASCIPEFLSDSVFSLQSMVHNEDGGEVKCAANEEMMRSDSSFVPSLHAVSYMRHTITKKFLFSLLSFQLLPLTMLAKAGTR